MSTLRDIALVEVGVPAGATFHEAAQALSAHRLAAVGVVDGERRLAGVFTDRSLLRGLFPGYLAELRHTAFLRDDPGLLAARAERCRGEPVLDHVEQAVELELETSVVHAAERFLHSELAALPVVEDGRYLGMLPRAEFAFAMLRRLTDPGAHGTER